MLKTGYVNIYRSGYFHREGKPGNMDRHAGDIYEDETAAANHIFPQSHFIATVRVEWDDPEDIVVNPSHSVPVPLNVSRRRFKQLQEEEVNA